MEDAGVKLIAQNANVYIGDLKDATNATNTFVDSTDKGGGRVSAAGQVMIGALRKVGEIAIEVFAEAAKATVAFVGDSISLAGDFDQKMSVLQATSGATADEMEQLADKAKELGSDLSLPATSAVDAGEAMLELAKAGFTVQEQMDATKGVLQLAAAAQIDEAKAAEINANALQAFGLAAKESMFVSDLLAASANASSINATDMADTYKMAGAIFSAFQGPVVGSKQALIDLTTAASLLGNAGIKGSDAGTALKQSLLQLTAPSDKAKGLMKDLAVDIGVAGDIAYDAAGNMRSFPEILGLVSESTKSLSEEQRNYIVSTIFGADAARAILILMQQGPDAWDKMTDAVTRQGAAQDLAAAQTKGWNGALEGAKSQVETLQLTIGQALTPILADLLNTYITPAIAEITKFADSFLKMVPAIAASDDPLQSFLNALKIAAPGLFDFIVAIEDIKDAITPAIQEIGRLVDAFQNGGLGGLIDTVVADITAALPDIEAALLDWGAAFIDWIEPMIPPLLDKIADLADAAWGWIQDQAPKWGQQLLVWGEELVTWIAPMIPPALAELGKLGNQFLGWIGDQAKPILDGFLAWGESFLAWIPGATVEFLAEWPNMLDQFLDWIGESAGPLLKQLGDWALSFIEWIAPMIPPFLVALGGVALAIGTWILETALVINKKILLEWMPAIVGWIITDAVPALGRALNSFLEVFQGWIEDAQRDLAIWMIEVGKSVVDGIQHGIIDQWDSLMDWLGGKIRGLVDAAMEAIGAASPAKEFMPVGQFAVQGIMQGLADAWPGLTNLVGSLSGDLIDEMSDIGEQMQNAIADSFGATASMDRQMAKNLDRIGDIEDAFTRAVVAQDLDTLQKKATDLFADPATAAKYFKMVSDHEFETLKIREQIAAATTQMDKDRLTAQLNLISRAQEAELEQFYHNNQPGQPSLMTNLADQVNAVMQALSGINLTDDQIKIVDMLAGIWSGLQQPINTQARYANPPMMAPQMAARSNSTTTNSTNISMPIYTNNSPAALQQSWAIVQASMT